MLGNRRSSDDETGDPARDAQHAATGQGDEIGSRPVDAGPKQTLSSAVRIVNNGDDWTIQSIRELALPPVCMVT